MLEKGLRIVVLTTKHIEIICGKSSRTARRLMQKLKVIYEKQPWQYITIKEFCDYMEVDEDWVREKLAEAL